MGEFDQRWGMIYPADNEDALPDGKTKSTPSDLRVDETDWGDVLQALIWLRNRHDGAVGDLADRPAAGADAPRTYTTKGVTDSAPTIYFNDENADKWTAISVGDATTLDGLDSSQFLRSDIDDIHEGSLTVSGTLAVGRGPSVSRTPSEVHLQTQYVSGVSAVSFTSGIDATFSRYRLEFSDMIPSVDGVEAQMQVSTDGGATWETGGSAYDWSFQGSENGNPTNAGSGADSAMVLSDAEGGRPLGNAAGESYMASVDLSKPASADVDNHVRADGVYSTTGGFPMTFHAGGTYEPTAAIDAVRFQFSSGTLAGTATLHGVAE